MEQAATSSREGVIPMRFQPIEGPECPACGCADCEPIAKATRWWGKTTMQKHRCNACGQQFTANVEEPGEDDDDDGERAEAVIYQSVMVRCPGCNAPNPRVVSSPKAEPGAMRTRYHICDQCERRFKSVEQS